MRRNSTLAVGIVLAATALALLLYAGKRLVTIFSFEGAASPAAVESESTRSASEQRAVITLTWDSVPNTLSYNLYWATQPGVTRRTGKKIAGVRPPYRFTGVEKGRTYHFVVTAVTDAGESRESDEIIYRAKP